MKTQRTALVLFCLLAVLAFAPMVQEHLNWPHVKALAGVQEEAPLPKLELTTYRNGQFQKNLEKYLQHHYGYRPNNIRLYNQYLWDCYGKTYVKYSIIEGKEGWLYEPWFVEDYYHGGTFLQQKDSLTLARQLHREAFRIFQLQNILEQYGITLLVCQAPGKDIVYPEFLPDDTAAYRPKEISAREVYEERFNTLGVNHINMEQWFLQMKDTVDFLLFPQKGTHWSNIAAVYAADSIFRYIEDKQGFRMNQRVIGRPTIGKFKRPDYDLEELYNLQRPLKKLPQHYVDVEIRPLPDAVKPKLITVGDSYFWNISRQIPLDSLFSSWPYLYYNHTVYHDTVRQDINQFDLVNELLSADAVMLIYSSTSLYEMSNDFCRKALIALCYDPEELDEIQAEVVETIKQDPLWLQDIGQRAEQLHLSLDTLVDLEANYAVHYNIEAFLPAMKDSIPTKRSTAALQNLRIINE